MVTADEVLLVSASGSVLLLPTATVPKFKVPLVTPTLPPLFEPPDRFWHPMSSNRPLAITKHAARRRYNHNQ